MKNITPKIISGLTAGWIAAAMLAMGQDSPTAAALPGSSGSTSEPDATSSPMASDPLAASAAASTNGSPTSEVAGQEGTHRDATAGPADQGLIPHLRGVTVDQALKYLADSAGFTITRDVDTRQYGTVDVDASKPLNKQEILALLNKTLARNGLTSIQDGDNLEIETVESAVTEAKAPVRISTGHYQDIPSDTMVETEIIPLHSLNPTQAAKDLLTLRPQDAQVNVSEGGNSLIMTAKRADIRRFTQILQALDSSGNGALEVFTLTYADSKSIADELKETFSSEDNNNQQATPVNLFGGRGGGGGFGGGGNEGSGNEGSARRTAIRVNAVSDDQNNAVLVSAPSDIMPGISNLVAKLDVPQDDLIQIRVFHLAHADPSDIATELATVFPDPNSSTTQNGGNGQRAIAQFGGGGPGGFGAGFGGAGAGTTDNGQSSRALKQTTVESTPDARTQSIIVTASKTTMAQVAKMIEELDANAARAQEVYVYRPRYVDVMDIQGPLQDLFASSSGRSSSSSSQANALANRMQQGAQQSTLTQSSGSGGVGGSSSGSRSSP